MNKDQGRTDEAGNREYIIEKTGGPLKVYNTRRRRNPLFRASTAKAINVTDQWYVDLTGQLRLARLRAGLTQAQLGKLARTNQAAISRFELGKMNATAGFIARLSKILKAEIIVRVKYP